MTPLRPLLRARFPLVLLALATLIAQTGCLAAGSASGQALDPTSTPPPSRTPEGTLATATTSLGATPFSTPTPAPSDLPAKFGPGQVEIPILLYHHVSAQGAPARYTIAPADFEREIAFLQQAGYRSIRLSQVVQAIQVGAMLPERPIVLTFDDGNEDNFTNAFPILQKYGMIGVEYVVANRMDSDGYLSADQIRQMAAAGWEIGSHSMSHVDLTAVDSNRQRIEIHDSKIMLQNVLGFPIDTFAYPFGKDDPEISRKVYSYGYSAAVGLGISLIHGPDTLYYLDRREAWGTFDMQAFLKLLIQPE